MPNNATEEIEQKLESLGKYPLILIVEKGPETPIVGIVGLYFYYTSETIGIKEPYISSALMLGKPLRLGHSQKPNPQNRILVYPFNFPDFDIFIEDERYSFFSEKGYKCYTRLLKQYQRENASKDIGWHDWVNRRFGNI